jgi:hypothetical protein
VFVGHIAKDPLEKAPVAYPRERILLGGGDRGCSLGLERPALLLELGTRPNLLDQLRRLAPVEVPHLPLQLQGVSKGRIQVPGVAFCNNELVEDQHQLVMVIARLGELRCSGCAATASADRPRARRHRASTRARLDRPAAQTIAPASPAVRLMSSSASAGRPCSISSAACSRCVPSLAFTSGGILRAAGQRVLGFFQPVRPETVVATVLFA